MLLEHQCSLSLRLFFFSSHASVLSAKICNMRVRQRSFKFKQKSENSVERWEWKWNHFDNQQSVSFFGHLIFLPVESNNGPMEGIVEAWVSAVSRCSTVTFCICLRLPNEWEEKRFDIILRIHFRIFTPRKQIHRTQLGRLSDWNCM